MQRSSSWMPWYEGPWAATQTLSWSVSSRNTENKLCMKESMGLLLKKGILISSLSLSPSLSLSLSLSLLSKGPPKQFPENTWKDRTTVWSNPWETRLKVVNPSSELWIFFSTTFFWPNQTQGQIKKHLLQRFHSQSGRFRIEMIADFYLSIILPKLYFKMFRSHVQKRKVNN